jgi:uridine kinase
VMMSNNQNKPLVIAVAGPMGCGKTTLIMKLAEILKGAPVLIFDHYQDYIDWPLDLDLWLRSGVDPNQVAVPRMIEDLRSLLARRSIVHPKDQTRIKPGKYIFLEDPFGTERDEIEPFVNLLVFIDVPQDVCVVRMVRRALGMDAADFEETVAKESREALLQRLDSAAVWLKHYMWIRSGFGITETIKQKADLVIDGLKTVDEMADEVLSGLVLKNRIG